MDAINAPYPQYFDLDGSPLDAGYVWFGVAGLNPVTSPVSVYWDAAGTQPAAQPVRTVGGYLSRNGSPAQIYLSSDYSTLIRNTRGQLVGNSPALPAYVSAATLAASGGSARIGHLPAGTGAVATNVQAALRRTAHAKGFGAVGDGVADDTAELQAAIDAMPTNGILVFFDAAGNSTYKISNVLQLKSNITLDLTGATIVNDLSHATAYRRSIFAAGNLHPAAFSYASAGTGSYLKCLALNAVAAGDNTVTFTDIADAAFVAAGDFVVVRTAGEYAVTDGTLPYYGHICKVLSVAGAVITIDYLVPDAIASACLSPIKDVMDSEADQDWSVLENVTLIGGNISARNYIWSRPALYKSVIRGAEFTGESALVLNAFVRSRIENCRASVTGRMVELKCLSHDSEVENCHGFLNASTLTVESVTTGESSRDISMDNVSFTAGAKTTSVSTEVFAPEGFRLTFRNCNFSNQAVTAGVVGSVGRIKIRSQGGYESRDILLDRVRFSGNLQRTYYFRIGDAAASVAVDRVTLLNCAFGGAVTNQHLLFEKNTRSRVYGLINWISGVASGGSAPYVDGRHINAPAASFSDVGGTPALTLAAGNRIKVWALDAASSEDISWTGGLGTGCTGISIEPIWCNLAASAGDVVLNVTVILTATNGDLAAATSSITKTITSGLQYIAVRGTEFIYNGTAEYDTIIVRVRRVGGDAADTVANDIGLLGALIRGF